MQLKALILTALAAAAAAAPSAEVEGKHGCEPGTYDCREHGEPGWRVCDTNGKWRVRGSLSFFPMPRFSIRYRGGWKGE
ncbi:hypothetical protein IMZ48_40195 [Candidatus Bathyarchaeota archaeon]|nr:hypothetical protein [Candidatus Bathyarchaeota archaeon]